MFEKFYKYLLIKGFNETYAKELISKMERGIAEDKDYDLLQQFLTEMRKE